MLHHALLEALERRPRLQQLEGEALLVGLDVECLTVTEHLDQLAPLGEGHDGDACAQHIGPAPSDLGVVDPHMECERLSGTQIPALGRERHGKGLVRRE